jgi:hypothetical protein
MNVKNENFTPRERVNRELLDRMLADSAKEEAAERSPLPYPSTIPYPATPAMACHRHENRRCPVNYANRNQCAPQREDSAPNTCRTPVYPGVSLAMVYSPCQAFADLYEPEAALERGTIFRELDKPFYPTPCQERWCRS